MLYGLAYRPTFTRGDALVWLLLAVLVVLVVLQVQWMHGNFFSQVLLVRRHERRSELQKIARDWQGKVIAGLIAGVVLLVLKKMLGW